jgi:hypothetical protein
MPCLEECSRTVSKAFSICATDRWVLSPFTRSEEWTRREADNKDIQGIRIKTERSVSRSVFKYEMLFQSTSSFHLPPHQLLCFPHFMLSLNNPWAEWGNWYQVGKPNLCKNIVRAVTSDPKTPSVTEAPITDQVRPPTPLTLRVDSCLEIGIQADN